MKSCDFRWHTGNLIILFLICFHSHAQTNVSGFISANTNWNIAGSPYIVTSNALVSQGYTLTIDPGVTVKFNTNCALQVDGEIIAIGNAQNHITFTSNQALPKAGDWGKLHIADNSIDAVYDSNGNYVSGCILKYCDISYGGGVSYGAVHIVSAMPYISQCRVEHSKASGIYCSGSSYILDSSLVNDCINYGLYFENVELNSCGLNVRGDTISNNKSGGLYVVSSPGCGINIENNYFLSNSYYGGLYFNSAELNVRIIRNNFISNTGQGAAYLTYASNVEILENNFLFNVASMTKGGYPGILTVYNGSNVLITKNYFISDTIKSSSSLGGILTYSINGSYSSSYDTIECNVFQNNVSQLNNYGAMFLNTQSQDNGKLLIRNNLIDGNSSTAVSGFSVGYFILDQGLVNSGDSVYFTNNTISNNSSPLGTCLKFIPALKNNNQLLHIENNEFRNNKAKNIIYLDGGLTANSNYDFLYMKFNNFLDSTNNIELYNHIPYGSPNVHADYNYWGSTNTQHVDSIIYDYFDTANYSVVYYMPILSEPAPIDTTCPETFTTYVSELKEEIHSKAFPNPFSTFTHIEINANLHDASLIMFNLFGQKIMEKDHISGHDIVVGRETLVSGIYIYEVIEKQSRITQGKLVVQ